MSLLLGQGYSSRVDRSQQRVWPLLLLLLLVLAALADDDRNLSTQLRRVKKADQVL